jgi:hypothetical protein
MGDPETRSQHHGGNRALAGRKTKVQHLDDTEALTARQASKLRAKHHCGVAVAISLARLAYPARPS